MPQLDFHNPMTISQVVWMFLIFLVLYLLLARWALPQVDQVLMSRAERIRADLNAAMIAKDAADATVRELTEATQRAYAEAHAEIARAVAAAKEETDREIRATNQLLTQQLAEAEARIAVSAAHARESIQGVAEETAQLLVARLTGSEAQRSDVQTTVAGIFQKQAA